MLLLLLACVGPADDPSAHDVAPPNLTVQGQPRFGVDDLVCRAVENDTELSWVSDEVRIPGGRLPVADASRRRSWTCVGRRCEDETCVEARVDVTPEALGHNLLVVLLDDIGVDQIASYGLHPDTAPTPTLDALASHGVQFSRAWATPVCSPTRASIVTGKLPHRHGVGFLVPTHGQTGELSPDHEGLPLALRRSEEFDYTSVHLGKWHLAIDDPMHPSLFGFDHFAGSPNNLQVSEQEVPPGRTRGYWFWEKNTDGVLSWEETYATTDTVDDAVEQLQTLPAPWFLQVSLNAAHDPWHEPPSALLKQPLGARASDTRLLKAMIEAADTELARLLDAVPASERDRTTVFVLADNGTHGPVVLPPVAPDHAKGSLYEWGIRVPFWASGPLVGAPGSVSDGLVHVVDLYATAAVLAGVPLDDLDIDGTTLLPYLVDPGRSSLREVLVTEKFTPNDPPHRYHNRVARDGRYKLMVQQSSDQLVEQLWALPTDEVDDGPDLLVGKLTDEEQAAVQRLRTELSHRAPVLELGTTAP